MRDSAVSFEYIWTVAHAFAFLERGISWVYQRDDGSFLIDRKKRDDYKLIARTIKYD